MQAIRHGPGAQTVRVHGKAGAVAAFVSLTIVASSLGIALAPEPSTAAPLRPAEAFVPPADDADGDGYGDAVDRVHGDLQLRLTVRVPGATEEDPVPVMVHTEDDHWRFGATRELEWRHVFDQVPGLDAEPGSVPWQQTALRTGAQWRAEADPEAVLAANVRDDTGRVTLDLVSADAEWTLVVDLDVGAWNFVARDMERVSGPDAAPTALGSSMDIGPLELTVALLPPITPEQADAVLARHAPVLHFGAEERFWPTDGAAMERFHGFYRRDAELRTWTSEFNNGRDAYRLLRADFDGDGRTDHRDVVVLTDVLRSGGATPDQVHGQVTWAGGVLVVQYWFLSFYNFVVDDAGEVLERFAHAGDREFIQLEFADLEAAQNGTPLRITYSQHYEGVRVETPAAWLFANGSHPRVFVAEGSHASYPVPGDDSRIRRSFAAHGDVFAGDGEVWGPGDYELERLGNQTWHAGFKWGPATRHHRELGSAGQPLLQHDFSYPFVDPAAWSAGIQAIDVADLNATYNSYNYYNGVAGERAGATADTSAGEGGGDRRGAP